jgi:mono/diheme cytochrome c family protein
MNVRWRLRVALAALAVPALLTAAGLTLYAQGQDAGERTRIFLGLGPAPDEAAARRGEPLYAQLCASCHGPEGRGAQAPSLLRSPLVLHDQRGEQIGPVIKAGRPGTPGMPPQPNLTDAQINDVAQYLLRQVELTANRGTYNETYAALRSRPTGDPQRGQAFFTGAGGCTSCHSVSGDLARVGAKFPAVAALKARFLWPDSPGPDKAAVTTRDGQTVSGAIRRITDFEISLVDPSGVYHYWPRSHVTVEVEDKLAGHRALLPKYSDADINDLAAYLVTLR